MSTQQVLENAMLNRKSVSFQYSRIGKKIGEQVGNARVMFVSISRMGKKIIMADVSNQANATKSPLSNLRHFEIEDISALEILGDDRCQAVTL